MRSIRPLLAIFKTKFQFQELGLYYRYIISVSYVLVVILSPASLAGAGDIETHRVRPSVCLSVCLSVRPDEFVQAISHLLFTVGG